LTDQTVPQKIISSKLKVQVFLIFFLNLITDKAGFDKVGNSIPPQMHKNNVDSDNKSKSYGPLKFD